MSDIENSRLRIDSHWDAVVVGAGPAGSVSAAVLAARGWRVLLVEKSTWPRNKACGGCLNAAAVGLLQGAGLGEAVSGGVKMEAMALRMGGRCLWVPLPAGGVAVERRELDARLAEMAVGRGVTFWAGTTARLEAMGGDGERRLELVRGGEVRRVSARVVLACDGLKGSLLAGERWTQMVMSKPARLGFAATVPVGGGAGGAAGVLTMLVGAGGYVGMVRLSEREIHVGAALWPEACHARRGPQGVIAGVLRECGQMEVPLEGAEFSGTGPLTARRAAVAGPRVLAIGDACGYVEPFTGEGLAWAIRGAVEAAELLGSRAGEWQDGWMGAWQERFVRTVRRRQKWCWRMRAVLRRPRLAAGCLALAGMWPGTSARLARRICAG